MFLGPLAIVRILHILRLQSVIYVPFTSQCIVQILGIYNTHFEHCTTQLVEFWIFLIFGYLTG